MALTTAITQAYRAKRNWKFVDSVYALFILATGGLGAAVIFPTSLSQSLPLIIDALAAVFALVFIYALGGSQADPEPALNSKT